MSFHNFSTIVVCNLFFCFKQKSLLKGTLIDILTLKLFFSMCSGSASGEKQQYLTQEGLRFLIWFESNDWCIWTVFLSLHSYCEGAMSQYNMQSMQLENISQLPLQSNDPMFDSFFSGTNPAPPLFIISLEPNDNFTLIPPPLVLQMGWWWPRSVQRPAAW